MPEVLTQVDPEDSIDKFKQERGCCQKVKCPRKWPCRYADARECARDTMLGSECPKICECPCHTENAEGVIATNKVNAERARLESECIEYLLSWHTEKDPAKRSAAWLRMISAANDLVAFNEANPKE